MTDVRRKSSEVMIVLLARREVVNAGEVETDSQCYCAALARIMTRDMTNSNIAVIYRTLHIVGCFTTLFR